MSTKTTNDGILRGLEIAKAKLVENKVLTEMTVQELSFLALMEINDTLADIQANITSEVNGE